MIRDEKLHNHKMKCTRMYVCMHVCMSESFVHPIRPQTNEKDATCQYYMITPHG